MLDDHNSVISSDDEELTEEMKQFDELIEAVRDQIEEDENRVEFANVIRFKQMQVAYKNLKIMFSDAPGVSISYSINKPFKSYGAIRIEGKSVDVFDTEILGKIAMLADNIEAYPLANGKVRVTFDFHQITIPIE